MVKGFSMGTAEESKGSRRKRTAVLLLSVACMLAVIVTVGSLSPAGSNLPDAADPEIEVGDLLFTDDFVNDQNNWLPDVDTEAYFDNGELHLICRTPDGSKPKWFFTPTGFADIAFQIEARKISGPNQQYGLIFGSDGGEFYLFGVTENGFYGLMKWTGVEWVPIVDYTRSEHINRMYEVNTLTVFYKDSAVELHVNGQYLETVAVGSGIADSIGIYAAAEDLHVAFDNVRVYSLR